MNYLAVLIATRWGSSLGGINVFNTGLASAIAEVLHTQGKCVCFLEQEAKIDLDVPGNIALRKFNPNDSDVVEFIKKTLIEEFAARHAAEIIILGHDVKTGRLAINCSAALKADGLTEVRSVTISHMDYVQYAGIKGHSSEEVTDRFNEQRDVVADADVAFAVGPLLQKSFQVARTQSKTRNTRVQMLVPGTPTLEPTGFDESGQLRVFISGRLGGEDDVIKNGRLAVLSLADAYAHGLADASATWTSRGALYAFGVNEDAERADLANMRDVAKANFTVEAIPYSENQEPIFKKLRSCHIALMPSWHEGFGLTGWEALSLGVPLICSEQSGLAHLLKILRDTLPDINLDSIESVNLVGAEANGDPSQHDRNSLRDALLKTARDYPRRKQAALKLAQQLREEFTWERCAGELLAHLGWILPKSVGWRDRQLAAVSRDDQPTPAKEALIEDAVARAAEGDGFVHWETICSALNVFSNLGKDAELRHRATLFRKLNQLSSSLNTSLGSAEASGHKGQTRSTGRMDVHWRLMAASASIATSFSQFNSLIKEHLWSEISGDGFLRREFLYYASKFSREFTHQAEDLARDRFSTLAAYSDDTELQRRVARLTVVYPPFKEVIPLELQQEAFDAEYHVCKELESSPWNAKLLIEKCPMAAASLLAIGALRKNENRETVGYLLSLFEHYEGRSVKPLWRGDKRLKAALLTATIDPASLVAVLDALAADEEEAVRWAAVDIIFSSVFRRRLAKALASEGFSKTPKNVLQQLGAVVDKAVMFDGAHPWLQREFINLYVAQRSVDGGNEGEWLFTLEDFPESRWLFGPSPTRRNAEKERLHPEVVGARAQAKSKVKRILLVLPPIEADEVADSAHASRTTTPPLGIGLLGSFLSAFGHDVHIADCHRYPELSAKIVEVARDFDVVGFNAVISTVRSVLSLSAGIKQMSFAPIVVVGGPAVNLEAWSCSAESPEQRSSWDFEIRDNVEENLKQIVSSIDSRSPWPNRPGLVPNHESPAIVARGIEKAINNGRAADEQQVLKVWRPQQPLDRRLFTGPTGYFEPNATRAANRQFHEAHVVMSRGCDWNCNFCTERRELSHGEKRRPVSDVMEELKELSRTHHQLRIQFIDDNLLPQIAAPGNAGAVIREVSLQWANEFLKELNDLNLSLRGEFGWRGIFRIEDFLAYERAFEDGKFISDLRDSGCRMLAFGVEHGNEAKRHKLKQSESVSNEQIVELFARLRVAGIDTKAYFMLGGWKESAADIEDTVSFALRARPTLAYFALFKGFVPAVAALRREEVPGKNRHGSYLSYKQYRPDWSSLFSTIGGEITPADAVGAFSEFSGMTLSESDAVTAADSFKELNELGFRFEDLVKYNDYHSDQGSAGSVLHELTGRPEDGYFSSVNAAYLRFYLRPEFVVDYARLIADGY